MSSTESTTTDLFDLSGKRALVTGASRGIGRAIALGLASRGAHVVGAARDEAGLAETVRLGEGLAGSLDYVVTDVLDPDAIERAVEQAVVTLGGLDILVNNAGADAETSVEKLELSDWQRVFAINVQSAFLASKAASNHLRDGGGKVINVASMLGQVAIPYDIAYISSKHAIVGFTRALAVEWAHKGVQVNALGPGFVETAMTAENMANEAAADFMRTRTPMRRWAQVEEMVGPAIFLASPASDFMTGQLLVIDGGYTAQ